MRGVRGASVSLVGAALALGWVSRVSGYSQLVMEQSFHMDTTTCDGASCRKEIIGANEALGVGSVEDCSPRKIYWHGTLKNAPKNSKEKLFDLVYSCRKETTSGEVMLMTWEECGLEAEPCVDAGTDPTTFEVTYQIAFEFKSDVRLGYDVVVETKLYFNYLRADEAFYTMRSENPPLCHMGENCHRGCGTDEWGFTAYLEDAMGDGWNAGGINLFDHFKIDSRRELMSEVTGAMDADETATASARRASYQNTMLGGYEREIPVCLAEGEYLFSTEFHNANAKAPTKYGTYDAAAAVFSVGGRHDYESTWTFCGHTGVLSNYTYVRVADGKCTPTLGWGETAPPSTTPVITDPPAPTPVGGSEDDDEGNENRDEGGDGESSTTGGSNTLSDLEIFAIGFGALLLAGGAAAGGTYAQNKGWFASAGAAGAGAAGGAVGGAPNPDSDEFAP